MCNILAFCGERAGRDPGVKALLLPRFAIKPGFFPIQIALTGCILQVGHSIWKRPTFV